MKCVKHIVLSLMVLLVIGVCINNNKLLSFAEDQVYTRDSFKEGEYLLSGDYFKYDFESDIDYCTDVPIYFYLEHNDIKYTNYINHNSGVLEGDIDYYRGIPLLNKDSFEQKKANEIPYVDGKTILWELHGTGTLFGYCYSDLVFFGKVYEEPKFELLCDSTEMGPDDKVACQVLVDYSEIPNKVQFELSSDKFNIEDIKTLDGWKKTDDDKFIFESDGLEDILHDDTRITSDIIEFYITPKEKGNIDVEDAVKVDRVSWEDDYAKKELDSTLIEPMKKKEPEDTKIEIPKTGVESYIILGAVILVGGVVVYMNLNKKGFFKRI